MRNNWVLLKGRLCHTPNYSSTKKGLHKVAFRFAIPRPPRTPEETTAPASEGKDSPSTPLPPLSPDSDFVTVIIIGKLAWDFKQLNLQKGAAVRVQGRLRSWDISVDESRPSIPDSESSDRPARPNGEVTVRRGGHIEVIAEKIDPIPESLSAVADSTHLGQGSE
jgi:hypothetical protein